MKELLPTTTTLDVQNKQSGIALLPIGSFEQHGRHLPLATDTIVACLIADQLARSYPVLQLPPVTISCSHEHNAWAGTVSISSETLSRIVRDVRHSLARTGVPTLVLVNGHGGNYTLSNVVQEANADGHRMALFPAREDWQDARNAADLVSSSYEDMHAGELETSLLLHAHPDLVGPVTSADDTVAENRRHMLTTGLARYTDTGVVGRPSLASADKGKAVLESLTDSFSALLDLLSAS
ncbi:creatininase family protein [Actinocorallia populi]|uniref:creatininase family protein n=1 Tax=Actinocorallia populi TaxID=2079200 RepID=UPI000D088D25|nr:creatininase family protein [Actinocorallia populi]